jgi:hypothetical protein
MPNHRRKGRRQTAKGEEVVSFIRAGDAAEIDRFANVESVEVTDARNAQGAAAGSCRFFPHRGQPWLTFTFF